MSLSGPISRCRDAVFALLALSILPGVAAAAESMTGQAGIDELQRRFRLADRNGDGALSSSEAREAGWAVEQMERFQSVDSDHSGTITLVEIAGAVAGQVQRWLSADADRDGRVSEAEARGQPNAFGETFRSADADGDRIVTRDEFERFSQRSYYSHSELPAVAPNIIEKRF